jgi:1,4-dihydroxy-2-naphthoate octaprenyltransferase
MTSPLKITIKVIRPVNLLLAVLAYLLGVSIARYLGVSMDLPVSLLGALFVILALSTSATLDAHFSPSYMYPQPSETPKERETFRRFMLYLSFGMLAVIAVVLLSLHFIRALNLNALLIVGVFLGCALLYGVPPARLTDRGFGELVMAFMLSGLPMVLAFLLLKMDLPRLLTYLSFPILFFALAYLLVLDFPQYVTDQKYEHLSLLVRLTWQRAVPIHNLLLILAYGTFLAAPLFGFPYTLVWPVLWTIPLAIYQSIQLRNITLGLRPNWTILTITATALFGLATYLLMFTFWMR